MRWLILTVLGLWGCSDLYCGLGTVQDGSRCVPTIGAGAPQDTADPNWVHPLVPAGYEYLWQTDGCTTDKGKPGDQVYILAEGTVDASGAMVVQEHWYWFWNGGDWEDDCVDTIEITASLTGRDLGASGCSVCDEGYEGSRRVVEDNCGLNYKYRFVDARKPDDKMTYPVFILFDSITPSGTPNVDNAMFVFTHNADNDGDFDFGSVQEEYATGHVYPDDPDANYGYPGTYDWLGDRCYRS